MHLVREHGRGVPQESREALALLEGEGHLDAELSNRLQRMVGFRKVVHDYRELNLDIVQSIVEEYLTRLYAIHRAGCEDRRVSREQVK